MSQPTLLPERMPEQIARYLITIVTTLMVLVGVGLLIHYFYSLTSLLGIALILIYILLGPVNLMEHGISLLSRQLRKIPFYHSLVRHSPEANPRVLAVLIVYLVFFLSLTLGGFHFLPLLSKQLGEMGNKVGTQIMATSDTIIDWADRNIGMGVFRDIFSKDIEQAERQGLVKKHQMAGRPVTVEEKQVIQQSVLQTTMTQVENALTTAIPKFISLVGGTLNGFIYFLSGLLLIFYFLVDGHRLKEDFLLLLPADGRSTANSLLASFHQVMFAFIKGQVMLGMLTGFYMFIVYSIFHVPFAFLLGVIFALAELLPVVGTWIGIIIGLTVILLNMPPMTAVWVWLCSYCYQTIKDNILAPKVVGDVMGLHPLVIILALMICAQVAGMLGILMALPLASVINVVLRLILQKDAQQKSKEQGNA